MVNTDSSTGPDPKWGKASKLHDPFLLANFKARNSDVLITTAPKAGTTWMQQILHQLKTGGDPDFYSIDEVVPWLEITRKGINWQQILNSFEDMSDPRIFKTHCTYQQTPGIDTANIILTSRDPRDCCISFYHHVMDMNDEAKHDTTLEQLKTFNDVFESWMDFGSWYNNVKSWWPHIENNNILWLRFEDMKSDLESNIDTILKFLDWTITEQQRKHVLSYCSFDWMKANTEKFTRQLGSDKPLFKPGGFIRKGKTGDHKTKLSAEQEDRILQKARNELEPDCLRYLDINQ